ncbi:MAG: polysaccharide biosynthesis tyrosine autokinase [Opitutus sp.]|nr:polysaccharide biosynthesis tyrosine autokinase [Opitutus sp.]MCS6246427.1 polysaccharide biosynthesis tyrosine autokinase [Opitutus sp.]MCS6273692.1 polysaccharide biosynthesis tyrosine autokinase [Opitutus sp.]MCS6277939.1 polysaccharide biosynthesis tyrosine autokinase [Opitutus sp.]MCS6298954.1 polysaccharide biosynthesis tyrosine autokinase [Opitutus sp.]
MDSHSKQSSGQPGGGSGEQGYGGGYGGYDAVGYGGESSMQRGFQDYALILRERMWYIIVVFLVVFSSALVYTFSQTKIYQSSASVQIFRSDPTVMKNVEAVVDNTVRGTEDLNTVVEVLSSGAIIQKVAERITGEDMRQFMAPYEKGKGSDPVTPLEVLGDNRKIVPKRLSLLINVVYRHPDRLIAAKVANLFVDEFIAYNARVRIDESMKAVEELKIRAEQQERTVKDLANELQSYLERNNMVSLDQRKDIVTEKLKALNLYVTSTDAKFKDAGIRWKQVQERQAEGGDLTQLSFIAAQPLISQLLNDVSSKKIVVAQLRDRYREKHPIMMEAMNSLAQAERELSKAIINAAATIESDYQSARRNDEQARGSLATASTETMALDRAAVEYSERSRKLVINEQLLQNIIVRMRDTTMISTMETQNARVVDKAAPSQESDYVSPKIPLNLGLGFVGGLGLGLAFAFFVSFIDDRVKSSFDIESVVGLPLIGIIPQIKKMEQPDKAQIVINNADRQVCEAFLTLHSSLRLKDESKNAQCILVTSTIPGEGKSFTTTNLALTFAAHGERVAIIDCDLRKPNVHKSFRLENRKGVIDICAGTATIDDVVVRGVHPNLDVITTGGRAKNPTQILNGKNFESMIADLRKRYDRIFFDTPPLAAVSDALIVLPLVDGSVFTVFFNKVRRKAAQFSAKKLTESNVPVFGAVLNGLNLAVSGYYYAQYYDKSYKDYYVVMSKEDATPER